MWPHRKFHTGSLKHGSTLSLWLQPGISKAEQLLSDEVLYIDDFGPCPVRGNRYGSRSSEPEWMNLHLKHGAVISDTTATIQAQSSGPQITEAEPEARQCPEEPAC